MARDYSKSKDAQLRATQKYNKENTIQVVCRFNKNTDADIVDRIQEVENKNGFIKSLIRAERNVKMKTITAHGQDNMIGYEDLARHEQFLYSQDSFTFMAIKIDNNYSAFINGVGKFILAKKYNNCLSIGSGYVIEYDTFDEAESAAAKNPKI